MSRIALFGDQHNYFLYAGRADLRKSFDALSGILRNELGREVNVKDVFIFLNKELTHIKILLYETDGFTLPAASSTDGSIQLTATDLLSMLHRLNLHLHKKTA
jgi:transposase